jgi:NmrA-like family
MASRLFNLSILTRPTTPQTSFPPNIPIRVSDYSPASLAAAFAGQDAVLSLIAGSAVLEQTKMIDAAVQAGVKRFVVSEWGADTRNAQARDVVQVFWKKVGVVDYARAREGQGNFSWSAVVTGPWFDRVGSSTMSVVWSPLICPHSPSA